MIRNFSRQLGALALLALLVRAILPGGYMLASAETPNGRYLIVTLCEGHEKAPKVIDLHTGKEVDPGSLPAGPAKEKPSHQPCAFASPSHFSTPTTIAEPVVFPASHPLVTFRSGDVRPGRGIAAPPPPSTGPPSLI